MDAISAKEVEKATEKPSGEFYPLTDERICLQDHLRLAQEIVQDVGPAALVAAAIYQAVDDRQCYVSADKLAELACCCTKTVGRAISPNGPLVKNGWLVYVGRQRFSAHVSRVRRTPTVQLTEKALKALDGRYHALPRAIVGFFQEKNRLTWAEMLVLAEVTSRWNLTLVNVIDGAGAAGREWVSVRELELATGLCRRAIKAARKALLARHAISVDEDDLVCLGLESGFYESHLTPLAADVTRSKTQPREWTPAVPRKEKPPRKAPAPVSAPANNQFFLPIPIGRRARSAGLLSMATRRSQRQSGPTTRSAWIPAACSAAS